jgi:hypothetical protein
MDIELNYVNHSNDPDNSAIVIFQKNVPSGSDELVVAWKVIQFCGKGGNHPFIFSSALTVNASDSYGNYMPKLPAQYGLEYAVTLDRSGHVFGPAGPATSATQIQIRNALQLGAINAEVQRSAKRLAVVNEIAPGQIASFEFNPVIWIGAVSQAVEGEILSAATVATVDTEISLEGILRADIVATGGGSQPMVFSLDNVVTV